MDRSESKKIQLNINKKQECIPVGCVSSAAVTVTGGGWAGVCLGRYLPGGCLPRGICPEGGLSRKCNSMPFSVAWAYYGKVLVLASAAS